MDTLEASLVRPNQHAEPPTFEAVAGERGGLARVGGYQRFTVSGRVPVPDAADRKLAVKRALLEPFFSPRVMSGRTVLDVGGNAGFFSLWALARGAAGATSIDVDPDYVALSTRVAEQQGVTGFRAVMTGLPEWGEAADVTLAFAMVHWLYGCTTGWGSLSDVVDQLAARTRALLLVEWVAPEDPAIAFFGHLNRGGASPVGYDYGLFLEALGRRFEVVEQAGVVSPTRRLLACWVTRRAKDLDLSCPMPAKGLATEVVSSRRLAVTPDGVEHWSRVYDRGDRFVKQGLPGQVAREVCGLKALADTGRVPRVLGVGMNGDWAWLEMEAVRGQTLTAAAGQLRLRARAFAEDAIGLLLELSRAGVRHNDMSPTNLLLRDGRLVLLDFGWSTFANGVEAADGPMSEVGSPDTFLPGHLGGEFRPPGGVPCDVFSMGRVLSETVGGVDAELDALLRMMSHPDPTLRLTEVGEALAIVRALSEGGPPS